MARRTRSQSRQPGPSNKRPRAVVEKNSSRPIEVIELSDSEDEFVAPVASTKKNHPRKEPRLPASQPTSSKTKTVTLTFGKASSEILTDNGKAHASGVGSSQGAPRRDKQGEGGAPLFLPDTDSDDDTPPDPLLAIPVAQAGPLPQPPPPLPRVPDVIPQQQPLVPPPVQEPVLDPIDEHVARVLEIVPDVQPAHAFGLIEEFMRTQPGNVVEFVLHALFENPSYPKADKKGKRKRDDADDAGGDDEARGSSKPKIDYTSKERVYDCGPHYFERSLEQLMIDFPRIPKPHIRDRLLGNRFYAPTYFLLSEELKRNTLPFKLKSTNSVVSGKGKLREDPEFDKERDWVLLRVRELAVESDAAVAAALEEQECEEGEGIECGCCFASYSFEQMIQCPEAHLFCKTCMTSYASNLLGEHNPNIVCMDQSGCKLAFPESELSRFLSSKLLELYYRVKQRQEIEAAGLENLEECPFCEYKCVIENEMEKLFRCENADCGAVTCRMCKKPDHLPKSCKEVEEDKHLDAQHVVEEAMTQALMRNCPKCQKAFIKEMGCNKMTCSNCHTVSCYICRKIINGYDHFSNPPPYSGKVDKSKCNLWDPVETRHAEEVEQAAKRALEELRKSRPDVDASNIKVDIPVAPPAPRPPPMPQAVPRPPPIHPPAVFAGGYPAIGGVGGGGVGMGMGMGGVVPHPFEFGGGHQHQFAAPPQVNLNFGYMGGAAAGGAGWADPLRRVEEVRRENVRAVQGPGPATRARAAARAAQQAAALPPLPPLPPPPPLPPAVQALMAAGNAGRRRRR